MRAIREHTEQVMFVQWFRIQYPRLARRLFAVPNGEKRSISVAIRLKAEGVVAGVADMILLHPVDGYHGLCLEFKKSDETWSAVSRDQLEFMADSEAAGYAASVAFGFDHAKLILADYLLGCPVTMELSRLYQMEKRKDERKLRNRSKRVHVVG